MGVCPTMVEGIAWQDLGERRMDVEEIPWAGINGLDWSERSWVDSGRPRDRETGGPWLCRL